MPENAFVVNARNNIPNATARVTTATSRGRNPKPVKEARGRRKKRPAEESAATAHVEATPASGRRGGIEEEEPSICYLEMRGRGIHYQI